MLRVKKKGFTIVELVVVIAVVAILAAVLIPTFANVIKKANVSNDVMLVKNLNTTMAMAEVERKPATMNEVLSIAGENGFAVSRLTPTSEGDILWDQTTNRFILKDGDEIVFAEDTKKTYNPHELWKIVHNENELLMDGYSYYLADDFVESGDKTLSVVYGIDTGSITGLTVNLTTEKAVDLIVRTSNGDTLVVNAPAANVSHYGELNTLNVTAVAASSYHEYGTVGFATIAAGRLEVMASGNISGLKAAKADAASVVKVDMQEGAKIGAIEAAEGVELSEKVAAHKLSAEASAFAALFKRPDGTPFDGFGTAEAPFIISSMQDWKDMVSTDAMRGIYDEETASECKIVNGKFVNTFVYTYSWKTAKKNNLFGYWKVTCDLDFTNETDVLGIEALSGTIDFDGHTVKGFKCSNSQKVAGIKGGFVATPITYVAQPRIRIDNYATQEFTVENKGEAVVFKGVIKNLVFENVTDASGFSTVCTNLGSILENVTTFGTIESRDNNAAPFAYSVVGAPQLIRCTNNTNLIGYGGMVGGFVGKVTGVNLQITFEDCVNNGKIINIGSAAENCASMLIANHTVHLESATLNVKNCKNYGTIISVAEGCANLVSKGFTNTGVTNATSPEGKAGMCVRVGSISALTADENGQYVLAGNAQSYKLLLSFAYFFGDDGHGTSAFVADIRNGDALNAYDWVNYKEGMELTSVQVGDITLQTTVIGDTTYYVFNYQIEANGVKRCTTSWMLVQYTGFDSNGLPVSVYSVQVPVTTVGE